LLRITSQTRPDSGSDPILNPWYKCLGLGLHLDPDPNLDPWVLGPEPEVYCFYDFFSGVRILCVCDIFYYLYYVFMNFIYYSYFYTMVVGLILFTNVVLKFGSRCPLNLCLDLKCILGLGSIGSTKVGTRGTHSIFMLHGE
jgi:hypothetical protein